MSAELAQDVDVFGVLSQVPAVAAPIPPASFRPCSALAPPARAPAPCRL